MVRYAVKQNVTVTKELGDLHYIQLTAHDNVHEVNKVFHIC